MHSPFQLLPVSKHSINLIPCSSLAIRVQGEVMQSPGEACCHGVMSWRGQLLSVVVGLEIATTVVVVILVYLACAPK